MVWYITCHVMLRYITCYVMLCNSPAGPKGAI